MTQKRKASRVVRWWWRWAGLRVWDRFRKLCKRPHRVKRYHENFNIFVRFCFVLLDVTVFGGWAAIPCLHAPRRLLCDALIFALLLLMESFSLFGIIQAMHINYSNIWLKNATKVNWIYIVIYDRKIYFARRAGESVRERILARTGLERWNG